MASVISGRVRWSAATGCGKTLPVTEFVAGGALRGERCLLFAFEESRDQLFRNARGWGVDIGKMEQDGTLKVSQATRKPGALDTVLSG